MPRAGKCFCAGRARLPDGGPSDCTASPYGHCDALYGDCFCNYGECRTDADCQGGADKSQISPVRGDPIGKCVSSQCADDGGCGSGCDCEMTVTYAQFACQTPEDTCASDMDCVGQPLSWTGQNGSCSFTTGSMCAPQSYGLQNDIPATSSVPPGFTCQPKATCVSGRPFLVHGAERMAVCVARADWQADLAPGTTSCTDSQRSRAAAHWARVGAMEHASIAAFARFTLHLLSLGAPAELITLSQQAMGDETEHARLAYALASAYADLPLGPGPLAIHGSLDASTTDEIVATLIREGCIGETLAAVEARDALERDLDPAVRTALEVIARDELRHAELAWKALAWLLGSERVDRRTVRDEVARALSEGSASPPPPDEADDLRAFGVVTAARPAELREQAAHDVITRCIDSLVGRTPARPHLRRQLRKPRASSSGCGARWQVRCARRAPRRSKVPPTPSPRPRLPFPRRSTAGSRGAAPTTRRGGR